MDRMDVFKVFVIGYSVCFLLLVLAIVLVPVIYAIAKKKYWVMSIPVVIALVVALCVYLFPTRYPYMDPWIMGKTQDQIIALYGEPEGEGWVSEKSMGYDLGEDNGFFGVMSSPNHLYYVISFDENGRACNIYVRGPMGG